MCNVTTILLRSVVRKHDINNVNGNNNNNNNNDNDKKKDEEEENLLFIIINSIELNLFKLIYSSLLYIYIVQLDILC